MEHESTRRQLSNGGVACPSVSHNDVRTSEGTIRSDIGTGTMVWPSTTHDGGCKVIRGLDASLAPA